MDTSNALYLDLEQDLYFLTLHYDMCQGATDPEMIDWARFFQRWAEKATKKCGPWSWITLETARNIVLELERSKSGENGYEALGKAMDGASKKLNAEIKGMLLKGSTVLDLMK